MFMVMISINVIIVSILAMNSVISLVLMTNIVISIVIFTCCQVPGNGIWLGLEVCCGLGVPTWGPGSLCQSSSTRRNPATPKY